MLSFSPPKSSSSSSSYSSFSPIVVFIIISFQIALCGMLISLAYCSAKDFRLIDDNNKKILV